MNDLIEILSSPIWWFSVVVVGILINLISAYLKSPIDKNLSKVSTWWRQRTEQQKVREQEFINRLINDQHEQVMASNRVLDLHLDSIYSLALGIFLMLILNLSESSLQSNILIRTVFMALASLCFTLSFLSYRRAMVFRDRIYLARKLERQAE
jgi:hypothetical protein